MNPWILAAALGGGAYYLHRREQARAADATIATAKTLSLSSAKPTGKGIRDPRVPVKPPLPAGAIEVGPAPAPTAFRRTFEQAPVAEPTFTPRIGPSVQGFDVGDLSPTQRDAVADIADILNIPVRALKFAPGSWEGETVFWFKTHPGVHTDVQMPSFPGGLSAMDGDAMERELVSRGWGGRGRIAGGQVRTLTIFPAGQELVSRGGRDAASTAGLTEVGGSGRRDRRDARLARKRDKALEDARRRQEQIDRLDARDQRRGDGGTAHGGERIVVEPRAPIVRGVGGGWDIGVGQLTAEERAEIDSVADTYTGVTGVRWFPNYATGPYRKRGGTSQYVFLAAHIDGDDGQEVMDRLDGVDRYITYWPDGQATIYAFHWGIPNSVRRELYEGLEGSTVGYAGWDPAAYDPVDDDFDDFEDEYADDAAYGDLDDGELIEIDGQLYFDGPEGLIPVS